jgi:hypothetical protein
MYDDLDLFPNVYRFAETVCLIGAEVDNRIGYEFDSLTRFRSMLFSPLDRFHIATPNGACSFKKNDFVSSVRLFVSWRT